MVQVEQRPRTGAGAPVRSGHRVRALVLDIAAPIAVYYGIRAAGGSVWLALAAGGVFPAISTIGGLVARRRVDATGAVMLAALAVSTAFSLISGSPRALLARDGLVTAAWAGYMYLSLLATGHATFTISRPLLEGRRVWDFATRSGPEQASRGMNYGSGRRGSGGSGEPARSSGARRSWPMRWPAC